MSLLFPMFANAGGGTMDCLEYGTVRCDSPDGKSRVDIVDFDCEGNSRGVLHMQLESGSHTVVLYGHPYLFYVRGKFEVSSTDSGYYYGDDNEEKQAVVKMAINQNRGPLKVTMTDGKEIADLDLVCQDYQPFKKPSRNMK
ncbi:MAG TPA: hypothetical protein VM432_05495 [Bdellovibrionales bacterium]|nr:hypothetical protein [Bdellovibrionales bacterium]